MIATLIDHTNRLIQTIGFVAIAVIGLWLGWSIIATTAAITYSRINPERALAWQAEAPAALVALAEQRLMAAESDADLADVSALARRALRANPLEDRALRLLASVADISEEPDSAELLMNLAAKRSLRDATVQAWLFNSRVRSGDIAAALDHADAMLRTRPELGAEIFPALAGLAADAKARAALVEILAGNPPWRAWFLDELPRRSEPPVAFATLSELRSGPFPPGDRELLPYLDHLISAQQFELAFLTWIHFLPRNRLDHLPYVYNGDFEYPISGLPFDWVISDVAGATTEVVGAGGSDAGRAAHVIFANTRVPYRHLTKLLILTPGTYRLSGSVRADLLVNERGMAWRIYCAEGEGQLLEETSPVAGTMPWRAFEREFEVPATGCHAQLLKLELAARLPIEQQVSGEIWYDRLDIRRASAGITPTAIAN